MGGGEKDASSTWTFLPTAVASLQMGRPVEICVSAPFGGDPAASEKTEACEMECLGLKRPPPPPARPSSPLPLPSLPSCLLYGKEASGTLEDM